MASFETEEESAATEPPFKMQKANELETKKPQPAAQAALVYGGESISLVLQGVDFPME